jgi:sec-independent protein translocase protein TatA
MIGDLFDSPWKILIVAVVILVLFGSAKLPGAARSLGKSMRILKAEVKDFHEDGTETESAPPAPAAEIPAASATAAQRRIDDLERQLADLKQPAPAPPAAESVRQAR